MNLRQQYEIMSRARLYTEDRIFESDEGALKILQGLIEHTMPPLVHSTIHMPGSSSNEEKVPFRLVSTSMPPAPISLCPRPAPPPLTREPDAEDTHEQAVTRRQRSEAVAIDGSTILRAPIITARRRLDKRIAISHAGFPTPAPALLLITRTQQRRKTRPPVRPSELGYHPYNTATINPRAQPNVKICPTLDVDPMEADTIKSSRRQRRKRCKAALKEGHGRLARFWRPNATWSGPCRGYAYGYL